MILIINHVQRQPSCSFSNYKVDIPHISTLFSNAGIFTRMIRSYVASTNCFDSANLCTKFELSMFTHSEDIKGDEKCRKWSGLEGKGGVRGRPLSRRNRRRIFFSASRRRRRKKIRLGRLSRKFIFAAAAEILYG